MTKTMTYGLKNSRGMNGPGWRGGYGSQSEAARELQRLMHWDSIVLSRPFPHVDGDGEQIGEAVAAYETQDACDADGDGSLAPWIIATRANRG